MPLAPLLLPRLICGDAIPQSFALALVRDRRCRGLLNPLWGYYSAWSFPGGGYEGAMRAGREVVAKRA